MNTPLDGGRLTLHRREQSVARVLAGQRVAGVDGAFGGSVWDVRQWLGGSVREGALSNRASAPAAVAGRLAETTIEVIAHLRGTLRMTVAAVAATLGWRVRPLRTGWRAGFGLMARIDPPEPVRRCQCVWQGELIYLDIRGSGWFDHHDRRVTGSRRGCSRGAGRDFVHVAVDDATRRAFAGVPGDARKTTTTAFLLRALCWLRCHGIGAERVMTDNARAARMPLRQGAALAGHPLHAHPALHAQGQRKGRAVRPDPAARLGLWPRASILGRVQQRPAPLAWLVHPRRTTHSAQWHLCPTTGVWCGGNAQLEDASLPRG